MLFKLLCLFDFSLFPLYPFPITLGGYNMAFNGYGSPLKLKVMMVEKRRTWEKNGRQGAIYQLYGQLHNEKPEFPLYFVVSAPLSVPIAPNSVIEVPISGLTISLGEPLSGVGFSDVFNDVLKDVKK